MTLLEFIAGVIVGVFFYHVFLNKLFNSPKYKKFFTRSVHFEKDIESRKKE